MRARPIDVWSQRAVVLWNSDSAVEGVSSFVGVLTGPVGGFLEGTILVILPVVCDLLVKRVVQVGSGHEHHD